jgi:hypothetical protein
VNAAWFGGENTFSGGSNGGTVTRGRIWGYNSASGWNLLYVLDLPGTGTYNHTSGNWFTSGGAGGSLGDFNTLGKRTEYDTLSITYLGFSVGTT